ncbi:PepSY domain-containing protein [Pelagibius sp. Alg239-R121]|uniref:PepSY domain-containing protein n=1 Tax=Pelagibius sp. Alg239-R121 TaxID=2993448 RepID=UPI0024A6C77E|nr:PepSY domain-containing protein [Pelagibius sp. Alg239-R121]
MKISAVVLPAVAVAAIASITLAGVSSLPANPAAAAASQGSYAGKSGDEITKSLEEQGYEVRKIETEDGYLEAYALLDGKRFEIYVDPKTGNIIKIEQDD